MTPTTMTATDDLIAREDTWGAHNYHPLDLVIERAEGAWVTDVEGQRGILAWEFDLGPGAEQKIEVEHALRWPSGMALR